MTIKKKIVIEIEMSSDASKADMEDHFQFCAAEIISSAKDKPFHSWWKTIHSNLCDESYNVNIEIKADITE